MKTQIAETVAAPAPSLLVSDPESNSGEIAARALLQTTVRDLGASEVHFEPQPGELYRVRCRVLDGSLVVRSAATDARAVVKYLVTQAKEGVAFETDGMERMALIAVLPTACGDRVCVSFVPNPLATPDLTLDDLPMRAPVRDAVRDLVASARETGGAFFIAGARRDTPLLYQTLTALRNEVSDDDTIVLDDLYAKRTDRLLAQKPDVLIGYGVTNEANPLSYIGAANQLGVLLIAAIYETRFAPTKLYPRHVGTLFVRARNDTTIADRYELRLPDAAALAEPWHTADELFASDPVR